MRNSSLTPILTSLALASCGVPARQTGAYSAGPATDLAAVAVPGATEDKDVTRGMNDGHSSGGERGPAPRILIRDADLTFEVGSDDQTRAMRVRISDAVTKLGGYVASDNEWAIVLRVPSSKIDEAMGALDELGTVTKKSVHVQEVTAQHTDLAIRIDNATKLRTRLQSLLEQAKDVKEMLEVEKELARVTQELELLEGQMRLLEDRVALSTLTVSFEKKIEPGPVGWVFYGLYHGVKWLFVWD